MCVGLGLFFFSANRRKAKLQRRKTKSSRLFTVPAVFLLSLDGGLLVVIEECVRQPAGCKRCFGIEM